MEEMFNAAVKMAFRLNELAIQKAEKIHAKRCIAQNNLLTKSRKSRSMKEYWKKKKLREQKEQEEEEYKRSYRHESCYCHMGNPPCGFCTDSHYCEKCDVRTIYAECPKCGESL
jgi:hypothetical protein